MRASEFPIQRKNPRSTGVDLWNEQRPMPYKHAESPAPEIGGPGVYPPQPEGVYRFTQVAKYWAESQGPDRYRRGMYLESSVAGLVVEGDWVPAAGICATAARDGAGGAG